MIALIDTFFFCSTDGFKRIFIITNTFIKLQLALKGLLDTIGYPILVLHRNDVIKKNHKNYID